MLNSKIEKSKPHLLNEILEYVPNTVVSKIIVQEITGNIKIIAADTQEILAEKTIPFDTFIQIIDGEAEIVIDKHSNVITTGEVVIIPAHSFRYIKARKRLKLISIIIKSGYEGNITI